MSRPADEMRARLRAMMAEKGIVWKAEPGDEPAEFFEMGLGFLMGTLDGKSANIEKVEALLVEVIGRMESTWFADSHSWDRFGEPLVAALELLRGK